jgi:hypothetical protein
MRDRFQRGHPGVQGDRADALASRDFRHVELGLARPLCSQ